MLSCCPVSYTASSPQQRAVAIIPARYASIRLPGKPLLEIAGRPMILHVLERALAARNVVRAIVATLPAFVTPVGLFVNQPIEYVNGVASLARLGAVQLHGDETVAYAAAVQRPVVKALTLGGAASSWPRHVTVLLDAHDPAARGGTGRTIDWTAAAAIAADRPILLAGGVTPDNVATRSASSVSL